MIAIVSASGGCGSSSVAANLAVVLAQKRGPVCGLIDLNLCGGDLAALLNVKPLHTVADLCHEQGRLDRTLFQQSLAEHASGVRLLASPPLLEDRGYLSHEAIAEFLSLAAETFPFTVVELEDVFHREQAHAVQVADRLLVVLRLDFPCLLRTHKLIHHLQRGGIDSGKVVLVANRCPRYSDISTAQTREALGKPIAHFIPDDLAAMLPSANLGNPVVLEAPASKPSRALTEIAEQLLRDLAE